MSDQFKHGSDVPSDSDDEFFDSRISDLFNDGFPQVEPSGQFKQDLRSRSQKLFADHPPLTSRQVAEQDLAGQELAKTTGETTDQAFEQTVQQPKSESAKTWRRLSFGFVAAAAAVLVLVLWPARTAYSFDQMRARLSDESFLRINFKDGGQSYVGWVSSDGKFSAVESSRLVVWAGNGGSAIFDRDTRQATALTDARPTESSPQPHTQLHMQRVYDSLRVLDALRNDSEGGLQVIDESWQRVDSRNGADGVLKVRFTEADSDRPVLNASFGIDSSSGLPVWIELGGDHDSRMPLVYPKNGPTQLSSLGVPGHWASSISGGSNAGPGTDSLSMRDPGANAEASIDPEKAIAGIGSRSLGLQDENQEQTPDFPPSTPKPLKAPPSAVDNEPWIASKPTRKWPQPLPVEVPANPQVMANRIDQRLAKVWSDAGLETGAPADAPTLFRRMHLDLTGRIPHVAEIRQGIEGGAFDVDSLLNKILDSPDFDSNMASVWVRWLLPPDVELEQFGGKPALQSWLAKQFEAKVPYDQIVSQLLTAQGRVGDPGPVLFTTALEMKPDHLAKQTARTFLGTRIDCAMCHDHPYDTWTQTDFWGYSALFARISRPQGKMNVMSSVLQVKDVGEGEVTFPDTEIVAQPRLLGGELLEEQGESNQRRRKLADWITDPNNRQFARATVNLIWSHFFGAGLVHPRDDFGPHNPSLSPELSDELAAYFIEKNYDVRSVVAAIVLSDAYQQSSQSESDTERPMFNTMPIRWLNAEQLYDCLIVASGGLGDSPVAFDPTLGLNRVDNTARDSFIEQFGSTSDSVLEYQAGIPQALSLMNGSLSNLSAGKDTSRLLRGLRAPFFRDADRIETVFLSLVGRPPSQSESDAIMRMLGEDTEDATGEVLSDLVWALLNSAEFATIH